jgi:hypothetical protein
MPSLFPLIIPKHFSLFFSVCFFLLCSFAAVLFGEINFAPTSTEWNGMALEKAKKEEEGRRMEFGEKRRHEK